MTRVIHTGDTHIGYQQYHSPERRQDFLDAFERVVDDAVRDDVDAVVHAGDLFHDRRPDLSDLLGTLSALRTLNDAGIPFLAVVGNHESTRRGQWLDLFERLGLATRLGSEPYRVGDAAFYGLDHVPESRRDELEYDFEPHDAEFAVLVGHGLFTPFAHANWDTEEVLERSSVAFDAVLLGDNHVPDTARVGDAWVTYCGSTERASAAERDPRGYNLVAFDDEVEIRRRSIDTRPFVFVEAELAEGEGAERVRERVREHDLEDAVVVVEVTGEGEPVTPAGVEEFAAERGALIARVTDRREFETETELDVTFADPDDAVRERVRDLGLSAAALDVDETVRASKVADANVREEVTARLRDRLEDGELGDFEAASTPEDASAEGTGDAEDAGDAENASDAESTEEDESVEETDPDEGTDPDESAEPSTDDAVSLDELEPAEPSAGDGQVSMEDYL